MIKNTENEIILTKREIEVLKLISQGFTAKEVSLKLYIADTTVIYHKNKIREKFNVKNTAELISKAYELKML